MFVICTCLVTNGSQETPMAAEIDDYNQDEEEFLRQHWEGASRQSVLDEFALWIHWELMPYSTEILKAFNEIKDKFHQQTVTALQRCWQGYEDRFVVELDKDHLTKTPERILEKFVREWCDAGKTENPELNRSNYRTEFPDALRLRYVVNFLTDGENLCQFLEQEAKNQHSLLCQKFALENHKCNVHDRLDERKKGERSWKFNFTHRATGARLEVQICTQLQVAWDKKDHFLIYELDRGGYKVEPGDQILINHVSDQLYVVDRQLDALRGKIQQQLRQQGVQRGQNV